MATPTSEGTPRAEDRSQKKATQRQSGGWLDTFLNGVEAVGNKLPEPFTIFLILYVITAVASSILAWNGTKVMVPGSDEELAIKGLFTGEGMAWFTTTLGENYIGFPPLLTVLPILLAVGVGGHEELTSGGHGF